MSEDSTLSAAAAEQLQAVPEESPLTMGSLLLLDLGLLVVVLLAVAIAAFDAVG